MTYTREQILAMEPGKDLDRLVAEQVLKWDESRFRYDSETGISERIKHNEFFGEDVWEPFNPSTDIAAAWEVVEKLKKEKGLVTLVGNEKKWECRITAMVDVVYGIDVKDVSYWSKSAPEAICKTALLAVLDL